MSLLGVVIGGNINSLVLEHDTYKTRSEALHITYCCFSGRRWLCSISGRILVGSALAIYIAVASLFIWATSQMSVSPLCPYYKTSSLYGIFAKDDLPRIFKDPTALSVGHLGFE